MIPAIQRALAAADVRFVRMLWCDNANVIRAKAARTSHASSLTNGIAITKAQQALPVMHDAVVAESGLGPIGEAHLTPDWNTLTVLPFAPGNAQVLCDMTVDGAPWEHCPRTFLKEQIERLADAGIRVRAAFENEFVFLRRSERGLEPADGSVYAMTAPMNRYNGTILEIADALERQGVPVEHYYVESGPGQQELSIGPRDALGAADRQIVFRETVRGVAARHDLIASFLPKITEGAAGSGCHVNLSLWRDERDRTGDPRRPSSLSGEAEAFIAGVLHHLPALCALTLASGNSYRRIRPHYWAGAFTAWGRGNREAAVRVTTGGAGAATRFEVKTADASANPYLALGAILAAGADGILEERDLPPETTTDPGHLDADERESRGIRPLPADLGQALGALRNDATLLGALGEARARAYLAVKTDEWEATREMTLEDETRLLAERY